MNKAAQANVVQETNMSLINIRNMEVAYFATFFTNFGTQAAVLVAFTFGCITQVPGWKVDADYQPQNSDPDYFWVVIYWMSTIVCMSSSLHILVVSVFISVFGQGLALRGQVGSMVRSVEGMAIEQTNTLYIFNVMCASFAVQMMGMYAIMMDFWFAIISIAATSTAAFFWYKYSLRIYNRFSFQQLLSRWNEEDLEYNRQNDLNDLAPAQQLAKADTDRGNNGKNDNNTDKKKKTKKYGKNESELKTSLLSDDDQFLNDQEDNARAGVEEEAKLEAERKRKKPSMMKRLSTAVVGSPENKNVSSNVIGGDGDVVGGQGSDLEMSPHNSRDNITGNPLHASSSPSSLKQKHPLKKEGHITVKTKTKVGLIKKESWQRRYAVLQSGAGVYFYKDLRAYQQEPEKPLNTRPIDLAGYVLVLPPSAEPPFPITLSPTDVDDPRKEWRFRCDTAAEMETWVTVLDRGITDATEAEAGDTRR